MRAGTLFSGIGAPECAMPNLDWRWCAEIEPFPAAVHATHFPHAPNLGDVTKVNWDAVEPVDLLVAGSPCQSFSIAGKRLGLDDPRGNLAILTIAIARRVGAQWLVFENVPGLLSSDAGRDFGSFLGLLGECGYGWAYRVLDAQFFGVAQRRRRVFVVGCLGDWQRAAAVLFERNCLSGDPAPSREARTDIAGTVTGRVDRGGAGSEGAGSGLTVDALASVSQRSGWCVGADEAAGGQLLAIAPTLNANGKAAGSATQQDAEAGALIVQAFGGNNTAGPIDVATARNGHAGPHGRLDFESETFIAYRTSTDGNAYAQGDRTAALTTATDPSSTVIAFDTTQITSWANRSNPQPGDACHPVTSGGHAPAIAGRSSVRRLMPIETERLQGFPDGWTRIAIRRFTWRRVTKLRPVDRWEQDSDSWLLMAADGPRYRAIGNSMAVPVLRWILSRLKTIHIGGIHP